MMQLWLMTSSMIMRVGADRRQRFQSNLSSMMLSRTSQFEQQLKTLLGV